MVTSPPTARADGAGERSWGQKAWRYAGGSVVATVCSQVAFLVLYGLLEVSPGPSSVLAWLAGAVPNYWLNRRWTWQRSGRPSLRREVAPYAAIILLTLAVAWLVTRWVDAAADGSDMSDSGRVVVVTAAFMGVYVVMFVLRFRLLDRLFGRLAHAERADERTDERADERADEAGREGAR